MKTTSLLKTNKPNVEENCACHNHSGITLIALVITLIVMLILVAVTISIAVNGGLFEYSGKAAEETKNAIEEEKDIGSGDLETIIDGHKFSSIEEINNYFKNGTIPVTTEDILRFIEDNDVCSNTLATEFTEKLKLIGYFDGSYGDSKWYSSPVYRCSLDNKIYIVGNKVGHQEEVVEVLDWDGTTTLDNEGNPTTFSTPFGDFVRGSYSQTGEFLLTEQHIVILPKFDNDNVACILCYTKDGELITIEWND